MLYTALTTTLSGFKVDFQDTFEKQNEKKMLPVQRGGVHPSLQSPEQEPVSASHDSPLH